MKLLRLMLVHKWGSFAALLLLILTLAALTAELWIGSRALYVRYEGQHYLPVFQEMIPGTVFGQEQTWETDYRALAAQIEEKRGPNRILMPMIPWGPYETDLRTPPPAPPDVFKKHYLGTDHAGRDVLARLVYGLRLALGFAFALSLGIYILAAAVAVTSAAGSRTTDLILQRLVEIWSNLPLLYVVIAAAALLRADILMLLLLLILFEWPGLSTYIRAILLRERHREAYLAAELLGLPRWRLLIVHLLPHCYPLMLTFLPFTFAGSITSLTALDYLGFGLPAPLPSWGELLSQGLQYPKAYWLMLPVLIGLIVVLTLTTLIGEATRKAIHPRRASEYR